MKFFARFNLLDLAVLLMLMFASGGFLLAKADHTGVNKMITGKGKVSIVVYLSGFKTRNPEIFKTGAKTSLTIRNQPVDGTLTIEDVKHSPKQTAFLMPDGKVKAFDDPSQPLAHDYEITITDDNTLRTEDGYVIRGQKIKVGNLIELESFAYRVQGVVVDIH